MQQTSLGYLGDIEITKLEDTRFCQEQVGTLNVSVDNLLLVKGLKTCYHLNEVSPDLLLWHYLPNTLVVIYLRL